MLALQPFATPAPPHACPSGRDAPGREPPGWDEGDHWSAELLDQIDYGLVIVRRDLTVIHANRPALARLRLHDAPATLRCSPLLQPDCAGTRQLTQAVATAVDLAFRSTVRLGVGDESLVLAVVPLRRRDARGHTLAMLAVERERICTQLSLAGFGRLHGLTGAETSVLSELCAGHEPAAIAKNLGVSLSTVRTHVVAARAKLGVRSMREMLIDVARLPPIAEVVWR